MFTVHNSKDLSFPGQSLLGSIRNCGYKNYLNEISKFPVSFKEGNG
jgi:hypothetical protein